MSSKADQARGLFDIHGHSRNSRPTSAIALMPTPPAMRLQDLIEPPPEALTVFENGPGKWRVEAYFEDDAGGRDLAGELASLVAGPLPTFFRVIPDLNWVAISQAALPPVRAGRFTIHGSHDRNRVARGPNTILIDAGEAFGTAHHATTFGCLLAIDRLSRSRSFRSVLDLGCGSGVLAIAVAKSIPAHAHNSRRHGRAVCQSRYPKIPPQRRFPPHCRGARERHSPTRTSGAVHHSTS